MAQQFDVDTFFDEEAHVFIGTSETIRGLSVEAGSMDSLIRELQLVIPDLLELNGVAVPKKIRVHAPKVLERRNKHSEPQVVPEQDIELAIA